MNRDMPAISASTYGSATHQISSLMAAQAAMQNHSPLRFVQSTGQHAHIEQEIATMAQAQLRMVQVLIADVNENIPLEQRLLYKGEPKLTDATDQELFFEIDVKAMLDKHNAERVKIVDKKVKERTEYLDPVKIRELKMVVVSIAAF